MGLEEAVPRHFSAMKRSFDGAKRILGRKQKIPVILEIFADGYIVVHSSKVRVKVLNRLDVSSQEAEILSDNIMRSKLRKPYSQFYGKIAATASVRECVDVKTFVETEETLRLMRELSDGS